MRSLAVIRYRYLTNVRAAGWVLGLSIALVVGPVFLGGTTVTFLGPFAVLMPESDFLARDPAIILGIGARVVEGAYALHLIVLIGATHAFGTRKQLANRAATADLMDAAPVSPPARFWGDAAGIFAAAMTVHVATLPLLAFLVAVSPLSTTAFVWIELLVVFLLVSESVGAAWKLHASRISPNTARAASSSVVMVILVLLVTIALTRWRDFRDAWSSFVFWPSGRAWAGIVETIDSPSLLVATIVLLYAGFIAFYYFRGIRALERA